MLLVNLRHAFVPIRCLLKLLQHFQRSNIIKVPSVKRWLVRNPRFHLHFTPTYSSWMNLVERWFAALTDKALRRAAHRSVRRLNDAIKVYIEINNEDPKPLAWTKTADEILASIARFCKRTSGAGH